MQHLTLLLTAGVFWTTQVYGDSPTVVKLWSGRPPGPASQVNGPESDRQKPDDRLVGGNTVMKLGNVSSPEMHVFLPPDEKATGAACLVAPGGGFSILAWDLEGTEVAQWLNSIGMAAVVLKYRVPTRGHGDPGKWQGPVMDAQRALSLVRARAEEWQLDPKRVGILGFSAGGETAARASVMNGKRLYAPIDVADQQGCAADFAVLIYPAGIADQGGGIREEYSISDQLPPIFFAHAGDDRVSCEHSVELFLALKRSRVPAELHVYRDGGHGYGLRSDWARVTGWPRDAHAWLRELGMLNAHGTDATKPNSSANPADHLPHYVRQITWFGHRPDWSSDGNRIVFLDKPLGDVFEHDLATGRTRPLTHHFKHHGFTRAMYLVNGDIVLSGLGTSAEMSGKLSPSSAGARHNLSVLKKGARWRPQSLNTPCGDGLAVSRSNFTIAWTHRSQSEVHEPEKNQLMTANLEYVNAKPRLVNRRVVFDGTQFPFEIEAGSLQARSFAAFDDQMISFSGCVIDEGGNSEVFLVNTKTGEYRNVTKSPDRHDLPAGMFPDGKQMLVESVFVDDRGTSSDLVKVNVNGKGMVQAYSTFSGFRGTTVTDGVVSGDGRFLCFRIGRRHGEADINEGLFLMNLGAASSHLPKPALQSRSEHPLQVATDQFVERWQNKAPLPQFSRLQQTREFGLSAAYRVQRSWVRRTLDADGIGGVKGAAVTPRSQTMLGIKEPVGAILRGSGRYKSNETIAISDWPGLKIETEIGFVVGRTIDRRLETVDELKRHIRSIVPTVELPAGSWDRQGKPTPADIAAINVGAAAYIVGTEVGVDAVDPRGIEVSLSKDGRSLHIARGRDCWNGPWETCHWLVNFALEQGVDLKPGQVILCGALGEIHPGSAGSYSADFGELGRIDFALE